MMKPSTRITESDHISGKVTGWARANSIILMATLCVKVTTSLLGQGPIISGQVIMEDGTSVPESIQVYMLCDWQPIRHSFTGADGSFSFDLGISTMVLDASIPTLGWQGFAGNEGFNSRQGDSLEISTHGCELQIAALPGFTSESLRLGYRSPTEDPYIGVIVLHPLRLVEGTTVSMNTLLAPQEARKAYDKARKELVRKKVRYSRVTEELEKAVQLYPEFGAAWNLLAETRLELQDRDAAREAFKKSITADAGYLVPYWHLARMDLEERRWKEAADLTDKLVELDPNDSLSHYFHAQANYHLGDFDRAVKCLRTLEKNGASVNYPGIHLMLGNILVREGKLSSAVTEYHRFLDFAESSEGEELRNKLKAQLARWERQGLINKDSAP